MHASSYLHMLDGRLRIKVPEIKRSPERSAQVEEMLGTLEGVTHVHANPLTGNVLVLFRPETVTHGRIVDTLKNLNYLKSKDEPKANHRFSDFIVRTVAELAFERMLVALL
jgi:copper chaperone CopZ